MNTDMVKEIMDIRRWADYAAKYKRHNEVWLNLIGISLSYLSKHYPAPFVMS